MKNIKKVRLKIDNGKLIVILNGLILSELKF